MNFATATETEVRDFLRLCLEPRPGHTRPPEALAQILPGPLRDTLHGHAPHLAGLHQAAAEAAAQADRTAAVYADALRKWIENEPEDAEVFLVANGAGHNHWGWRCRKSSAGCGYETPFYFTTEDAAQAAYDEHRGGCRTATADGAGLPTA